MSNDGVYGIGKAEPFNSHLQLVNTHHMCLMQHTVLSFKTAFNTHHFMSNKSERKHKTLH